MSDSASRGFSDSEWWLADVLNALLDCTIYSMAGLMDDEARRLEERLARML